METHANYRLVGIFVLVLVLGFVAFVVWLAKVQLGTQHAYYDIYFSGPITGLGVGSEVSYRGVSVGTVREITIDPTNLERVRVTIEVAADTPIREDTVARLEVEGLVGATFVLLSGGTQSASPLTADPGQRYPVIASMLSPIQAVIESAPRVADQLERILAGLSELTSAENIEAIEASIRHLSEFSAALGGGSGDVRGLFREGAALAADLRAASQAFERLASQLGEQATSLTAEAASTLRGIDTAASAVGGAAEIITREAPGPLRAVDGAAQALAAVADRELPAAIAEMRQASRGVSRAAEGLSAVIAENREPLRDFTSVGLIELTRLLADARHAVQRLGQVAKETEADPQRFLFGNRQRGYAIPQ